MMAFMSLTAFADNIVIVPTVIDKAYGEADPGSAYGGYNEATNPNGVKTTMFYVASPAALPTDASDTPVQLTVEDIAKCLKVVRAANYQGESVGSYKYIFQVDLTKRPNFGNHTITVQQNGDLNINKANAAITGLALAGWTYGDDANEPSVVSALAGTVDVPVVYSYANGNNPDADGYAEGTYDEIVNGQAGNYYVKATVAETTNYNGATGYAAFTIEKKDITSPAFGDGPFVITYGESAPDWGLTFTEDDLVDDADADQFEVVEQGHDALPTAAKAEAYTVAIVDNSGNYNFASATAQYTINFKAINSTGIAIQNASSLPSKTYKAEEWVLTTADTPGDPVVPAELIVKDGTKRLVAGTDYTVDYEDNTNAGTATITITGAGNYATVATNKLTATFTINPATLNVALVTPAQNIAYGGAWNPTVAIAAGDWKSPGDQAAFDPANLPTATIPAGADYDADEKLTAGEHIVTISGGTAPANYVFACADDNTVTVGKAIITISLKTDATTPNLEWNGTATASELANALASAYKLSVDLDPAAVFSTQPTVVSTAAADANYQPGTYAIAFQAHDAVIAAAFADKYTLAWDDAAQDFTITKKALTITAKNQAVAAVGDAADSDYDDDAEAGVTIEGFATGEDIEDNSLDLTALILTLTDDAVLTAGGTTPITPSGAVSAYYDIEFVAGTLTVARDGVTITLPFTDEAEDIIAAADGKNVKVAFGPKVMTVKEWYAMVLPFEVDPLKMANAFGRYVIFNVLNTDATDDGNFKFKLTIDAIPAGTPFLIKFAGDEDDVVNWNTFATATYGTVEISDEITDTETEYVDFTGTYVSKDLQGLKGDNGGEKVWWLAQKAYKGDNNWKKPKTNKHTAAPMEAYLTAEGKTWTSYAPNITVEDFDGQTTAIQTLNAEQINGLNVVSEGWYTLQGVKLDSAPTQKGIYIFNGKKVAVQ